MTEPLRLLTVAVDSAGAAEMLGISERLVRTLTDERLLPVIDLATHKRRIYSVDALRRWALESSGYTPAQEDQHEAIDRPAATLPAQGREVERRGPGRPRKSRASGETLPLRVVEG